MNVLYYSVTAEEFNCISGYTFLKKYRYFRSCLWGQILCQRSQAYDIDERL